MLITYAEHIRQKVVMLDTVYSANRAATTALYAILLKWSRRCLLFAKWGCIPCGACMSVLVFLPFVGYSFTGTLEPILPTFFPFIDEDTRFGYVFHFVVEFLICVLGLSGTCGADFMLFVLIVHMWPLCLIFDRMFHELNDGLLVERNRHSLQIRDYFRNIIMVHQDISWFAYNIYIIE